MTLHSPMWLLVLLAIPLALLLQFVSRRRARRYAVRFTALSTLAVIADQTAWWRRAIPVALLFAAVAALAVALARPSAALRLPVRNAQVVLVTDHSGSMSADDVQPTRLAAAERAAETFIKQLPSSAKIGVVTFSTGVDQVQVPSTNHDAARQVIAGQHANGATATGDALAEALSLLRGGKTHLPSAIVLLSDGATNEGRDPITVAKLAGRERIPIDTVALGTPGATLNNPFGPPIDVSPDPALLRTIAEDSHGQAFSTHDADRLQSIYRALGTRLGSRAGHHDVSSKFAIAGLLLLLGAGLASQALTGRLP